MSKIKAHVMDLHERLNDSQIAERNARLKLNQINATVVKIQEMHHIEDEDLLIEIDKRLDASLERVRQLEELYEIGNKIVKDFETKDLG
jgi:hypothetical protein|tara:strand:+ start:133 stop:399 length:267 start_codon:yes stop_codon:yes gene_type:complete